MIKKVLISVIIVLLVGAAYILLKDGMAVFGHNIYGIVKIQEASKEVDDKIAKSNELNKITFNSKTDELDNALKQLISEKERYQTVLEQSSQQEIAEANKIDKFELGFLWAKIGNYATDERLILTMDITNGITAETHNLNFTIKGSYTGVTDFVYKLENDSKLKFKIENFKLLPTETAGALTGTFTVKDLIINF